MEHDPIEDDPSYSQILEEAEQEVKARMRKDGWPDDAEFLGWCHLYWGYKKTILREQFSIEWKSPAELNPGVIYD